MQSQPVLAVYSPLVGGFYFGGILAGITGAAADAGARVIAVQTYDTGMTHTDISPIPDLALLPAEELADGYLVVSTALTSARIARLKATGKPAVLVSNEQPGLGLPMVGPDNRLGVLAAVDHLAGHGHQRIAFIGCFAQSDTRARYAAYREGLERCGLGFDDALLVQIVDNNEHGGRQGAEELLRRATTATAVLVATDLTAMGVIDALTEHGLSLPEELAIVGFDDAAGAQLTNPRLTTIRQEFPAIGEVAGRLLLRMCGGERIEPVDHLAETQLVVRESCGCPPPAAPAEVVDKRAAAAEVRYYRDALTTQYNVGMTLLGTARTDPANLDWLAQTPVSAAVLGLWQRPGEDLDVAAVYGATGNQVQHPAVPSLPLGQFPQLELLADPAARRQDAIAVLPLRAPGSDWGWLGLIEPIDSRQMMGMLAANQWTRLLTLALDLDQQRSRIDALHRERSAFLEGSADAIVGYDAQLRYTYLNPSAVELFGVADRSELGRSDAELGRDSEMFQRWQQALRQVVDGVRPADVQFADDRDGREPRWFEARMVPLTDVDDTLRGVLATVRDITALKSAQQELAHQAVHDSLTGLPNRVLLVDRLSHAISRLDRQPGSIAVLFIDLDRFKEVNDSFGHAVGDSLLVEAARRIQTASRRSDTLARLGGDEFVLLCDQLAEQEDIRIVAERILRTLAEPFFHNDQHIDISASVGVVVTSDNLADAETVVRNADAAMYRAKQLGRNRFHVYDEALQHRAVELHELEMDLRAAMANRQLTLAYQPLFALATGEILGVEALIRWHHPVRGDVPPAEFIPLAEKRGLIVRIGAWVLDEALRQLAEWHRIAGLEELTMAVNLSGRQLAEPAIVGEVRDALRRHGVNAGRVTLEVTETALIEDAGRVRETLAELSGLGVRLALDDFGTGYSSLVHLRDFPVDMLKIDRSFVERLDGTGNAREIIGALTAMAHFLNMRVVGEGIERRVEWEQLQAVDCDEGQGFLVARAMAPEDLAALPGWPGRAG